MQKTAWRMMSGLTSNGDWRMRGRFAAHAALYVLGMAALLVLNLFLTGLQSGIVLVGWGSSWRCITRSSGRVEDGRRRSVRKGPRRQP